MEVEGEGAEGGDGGCEPVFCEEAGGLSRGGCEESGRGLDEVYPVVRGGDLGEGVGGGEADDACAEDDGSWHVVYGAATVEGACGIVWCCC